MKFHYCWKQSIIKFIFGRNSRMRDRINYGDLQSYVDYRFLVINNRHSALEYFFHYNHGLNSNKWAYFKSDSSNSLKIYIFGMCKLRGIIWYIIHANRMLLKIWPHLTFGWPFVNISITIHPTQKKFCQNIFWPITSSKPSISHFRQNGTWVLLPLQSSI